MNYLVCYVWQNTKGNHAGMAHMCDLLLKKYPKEFKVIKINPLSNNNYSKFRIINKLFRFINRNFYVLKLKLKLDLFYKKIKYNDRVFLLEYLLPSCNQLEYAKQIKLKKPKLRIIALAHLTPTALATVFEKNEIKYWVDYVDIIMTLGSSLSAFLQSCYISKEKIVTSFHYVDHYYYTRSRQLEINNSGRLNVLVVGSLQRNFYLLESVVSKLENIKFTIIAGNNNLSFLAKYKNIELKGYISEKDLKDEMENADISLNILEDTVGSNVITTSLSMGLAIIVSDVGSIRDYCDESSAIFCRKENQYIEAIELLNNNRELLYFLRLAAIEKSKRLRIDNFYSFINTI